MIRTSLAFSKILLSIDNPRLDISFNEEDAIEKMIVDQKEKIYELAMDIVHYGLNPLELIAVYPSEIYPDYYEVAEGNRRVCALKLLLSPEKLEHINGGLFLKFKQLAAEYSVPTYLDVIVFEDERSVRHWMELRHMGEQNGKGLSKWNSVQKMRFQKSQTGAYALFDFWSWMDSNGVLSLDEITKVTKTNWQRVLREAYYPFLKLRYDGSYTVLPENFAVFVERIREVHKRLVGQTVGIVYDQKRIDDFFNKLSIECYGLPYAEVVEIETQKLEQESIPEVSNGTTGQHHTNGQYNTDMSHVTETMENSNDRFNNADTDEGLLHSRGATDVQMGKDVFSGCRTIIPNGYKIRSVNMRLNKIIGELKRLDPDEYPNACGTLLRTLFELSAKVFLENQTGEDMTDKEFQQAIRNAANQLRSLGRLTNGEHSAILKDVDSLRLVFNGYMHQTDVYPK